VSALRRSLKRPHTYLAVLAALAALIAVDAMRPANEQASVAVYGAAVSVYQSAFSPALSRIIVCRYQPTCSRYSTEAVTRFGIWRGLSLTVTRLMRCRSQVAPGTPDPLPALDLPDAATYDFPIRRARRKLDTP